MAPFVMVTWTFALIAMIGIPIAIITWFKLRHGVPWMVFLYGALVFVVFQMLTRIPLLSILGQWIGPAVEGDNWLLALYFASLGFSAGLFESVGRWVGYKWLFPSRFPYDWQHGVAFGLGHGAIESILLIGLSSLVNLISATQLVALSPEQIASQYSEAQAAQAIVARNAYLEMSWSDPLMAGAERLMALVFHVAMSLLVLQVFRRGEGRWLWLAVLLHGMLDFGVVLLPNVLGVSAWGTEIYLFFWAAIGGVIIILLASPKEELPSSLIRTQ